jgi:superfamily II DNA helicase RecQ
MPIAKIEEAQFNYRSKNVDLDLFQKGMRNLPRVLRGLGYAGLRPGQDQIVFSLMGGVDTLAVMATAAGKTACFVIPALCLDMRVLIFCPLKSLMRDQVKNLQRQGIVALNISSDNQEAENVRNISDWVRGDCKILYIAPERLNNAQFMAALRQMPPHMIVVDEMHVLSAWSDNFRASYQFIGDVIEMYNPRIVAGLTATLDKETERDVRRVLRVPDAPKIKIRGIRHNLKLTSSDINEHDDLVGRCREAQGSTLVYCGTQKRSEDTDPGQVRHQRLRDGDRQTGHPGGLPHCLPVWTAGAAAGDWPRRTGRVGLHVPHLSEPVRARLQRADHPHGASRERPDRKVLRRAAAAVRRLRGIPHVL